jgi:hypothetical protein
VARPPRTLLEVAYVNSCSFRTTTRAGLLLAQWALCRRELGRRPTVEEYADYWKEGIATAYRQLAAFREAFPGVDHDELAQAVLAYRGEDVDEATALASPPDLLPA